MNYTVKRIAVPPALDCSWEAFQSAQTADVAYVVNYPGSTDHHPKTQVRLLHDERHIYGIFQVEDHYVRVVNSQYLSEIWTDSCVEFFFKPSEQSGYFNLEMNAGAHHLMYYVEDNSLTPDGEYKKYTKLPPEDGLQVKIKTTLPTCIEPEIQQPITWRLQFEIPVDMIQKYVGNIPSLNGLQWKCNFYKCGDETSHPHWMAWAPLSINEHGFHSPEFFQPLLFE